MSEKPIVIARLNARLQPLDRGSLYEDPLDAALQEAGIGRVTGGGTLMSEEGEIELCDIEVELADLSEQSPRSSRRCSSGSARRRARA